MHVEFSRRKKLSVKIQTQRGRDYTLLLNDIQKKGASGSEGVAVQGAATADFEK